MKLPQSDLPRSAVQLQGVAHPPLHPGVKGKGTLSEAALDLYRNGGDRQ